MYDKNNSNYNKNDNGVMKNKIIVGVLVIILFFFIGQRLTDVLMNTVGSVSSCLLYPLLKVQSVFVEPVRNWYMRRATIEDVYHTLDTIKKERDMLQVELVALQGTAQYAKETRDLILFNKRYASEQGMIAQVLVRHLSNNAQFILVDVGSWHGIKKDMIALHNNNVIGRVDDVYPWYCKICLITDSTCKVAVNCVKTGARGIHQGTNKEKCTDLSHVSHLESIRIGDIVLSSGEGLIFPAGFALGTISTASQGDLFYTIEVTPAVDFSSLRHCILISKENVRHTIK